MGRSHRKSGRRKDPYKDMQSTVNVMLRSVCSITVSVKKLQVLHIVSWCF